MVTAAVARGALPDAAWWVRRGDETTRGAAGTDGLGAPIDADTVFRISSTTEPIAGTVPASRPITVRDLLTFRLGLGLDFTAPWPTPTVAALEKAGLPVGPPAPQAAP